MAQESLADKLVFFMRVRDEARAKIDAAPRDGDAWPTLSVLLDQQEKAAADALYLATITADRLGRLAEVAQPKKQKALYVQPTDSAEESVVAQGPSAPAVADPTAR